MTTPQTIALPPGYDSIVDAAAKLGVTGQTVRNHLRLFGGLVQLERCAAVLADPKGIEMPDGSRVQSIGDAARRLGVGRHCIRNHLCRNGHLRHVGASTSATAADRQITLAELPDLVVEVGGPRPETAPRHNRMVSAGSSGPVDIEAVIEAIRECRDEVLAERGAEA